MSSDIADFFAVSQWDEDMKSLVWLRLLRPFVIFVLASCNLHHVELFSVIRTFSLPPFHVLLHYFENITIFPIRTHNFSCPKLLFFS